MRVPSLLQGALWKILSLEVRKQLPDLVIVDILMPTMDGIEFATQMRKDSNLSLVPIIFCTGNYRNEEAKLMAQACGVQFVITKPAEPETILKIVGKSLGQNWQPSPAVVDRLPEEHWLSIIRAISARLGKEDNELNATLARFTSLIDLSLELNSEPNLSALVRKVCKAIQEIMGTKYASVGVFDHEDRAVSYYHVVGTLGESQESIVLSPDDPFLRTVLEAPNCLRFNSTLKALGLPPALSTANSALAIRLTNPSGRARGWLCAFHKTGASDFTDEEPGILAVLASLMTLASENALAKHRITIDHSVLQTTIKTQQESERKLKEARAQLNHILHSSPAVTLLLTFRNGEPMPTFVSKNMLDVLGYTDEEAMELQWWQQHLHPEDAEREIEAVKSGFVSDVLIREYRVRHRSGEYVWVHDEKRLLRDENGAPAEIIGSWINVSSRKEAEKKLHTTEERLKYIVSSSPSVMYILSPSDTPGKFLLSWVSDNIKQVFGYESEYCLTTSNWWRDNVHADDLDAVAAKLMSGQVHVTNEYRFRHQDGSYRWIQDASRVLHDDKGNLIEMVGAWSDVTSLKALEQQFRQSQKMEAVGRLAGGIAHDFNNLLTIINGCAELILKRGSADAKLHPLVESILNAGQRASHLTRQLLTFSRKQIVALKVLDLATVVLESEDLMRRLLGEDISLKVNAVPGFALVKGDGGQIEQVVLNLIVNSRDAMPSGGKITIEVNKVTLDENNAKGIRNARAGSYFVLSVSDSGTGMDKETQSHLFEPFFTTKDIGKGTGLGLATVHGIVEQLGGCIGVYSEVGYGTTIKIYLIPASGNVPKLEAVDSRGMIDTAKRSETILVVEDDPGLMNLIRLILIEKGFHLLEAKNGREAIKKYGDYKGVLDLVLTDIVMPEMGGRELVEDLSRRFPTLKGIYMSGYTDDAVMRHGILSAEVNFIQKPFSPDDLIKKILDVLGPSGG